jgi:histidinol phosphatase-like PHP family hydrolase
MSLDMHCHTVWSDWVNTRDELISEARDKWLEALFITDHDRVSTDYVEAIKKAGLVTVPSVEISTTNTKWDDKWLHMTYYANSVSDELLWILQNTKEEKLKTIWKQLLNLQEKGFYIDVNEFYDGIKWEGISNYDIARYIASKSENDELLIKLGCMNSPKPHSDFYRKCLKRGGPLYAVYSVAGDEDYKSELWDISELIGGEGVFSIAHPNYTFSRDRIRGFQELYRGVYRPQLWISAIEINTTASKKWVHAILEMKEEYWDELQLTFGSDCHRLWKPDDKHWDLGFENEFLDEEVVKREFWGFREKLWI